GVAAQEIIDRIEASDSRFPLDTGDLVDLKRKGVPLEVLRVVNQRRLTTPAEATTPTSTEVTAEDLVATPGQEASPRIPQPRLVIHHDRSGYSILKPEGFADLAQFQGARSLLQLVNAAPNEGSMPEIEISVLAVLVPPNDRERLVPSSLRPFIERVTSDLRDSFRQDGLELHAEAPTETWLAARPAMRVQTVTRATDGRSYLGAHTLVFSEGRFHIVSYHVSSEQSAQWRDQLERIVDSFSLDGSALESVADTGDPRASVEALFTRWRDSLRQRDFRSWRSLHRGLADSVANRLTWLDEIQRLTGDRRRLELGRIDLEKGRLEYRRFGLDGPSSGSRDFVQDRGVWYLATLP
ncbi:MAG: hypothetical protein KDB53_02560, partial [Planctomycetes bacterium]|nr:hypothetical protein [Planctomycetota bacterium]